MSKVLRVLLGVALGLVGVLYLLIAVTYLPSLLRPSISSIRILAYFVVPFLLCATSVGLFAKKPWTMRLAFLAFVINFFAGMSFVPFGSIIVELLQPFPAAAFVATHGLNAVMLAIISWVLRSNDKYAPLSALKIDRTAELCKWVRNRRTQRVATLVTSLSCLVWIITLFWPVNLVGTIANRSLLHYQVDVLNIGDGRVHYRLYDFLYRYSEPFYIDAQGGMPLAIEPADYAPLKYQVSLLGLIIGSEYERVPYRRGKVIDIAVPLWLIMGCSAAIFLVPRFGNE